MNWLDDELGLDEAWELDDFLAEEGILPLPHPQRHVSVQRPAHPQPLSVAQTPGVACPRPTRQVARGFPPHRNTFASLPREEQAKVEASAAAITRSFQRGCQPIREVTLVGHADRDAQRNPAYHKRISGERAMAVRQALARFINNPGILARIRWQIVAAGSDMLVVPNPRSEAERLRNRRVEIVLGPIPLDGVVVGVTVDSSGATLRLAMQIPRAGEFEYELYRNDLGSPPPLLPRTEWMRRGAMLGLAQRALSNGNRVKLFVAANKVRSIEVYRP